MEQLVTLKIPHYVRKAVKTFANESDQGISEAAVAIIQAGLKEAARGAGDAATGIHGALKDSGALSSVPKAEQVEPPLSPVYGGVLNSETVTSTRLHTILDELLESDQRAHIIALLLYAREWIIHYSKENPDVSTAKAPDLYPHLRTAKEALGTINSILEPVLGDPQMPADGERSVQSGDKHHNRRGGKKTA